MFQQQLGEVFAHFPEFQNLPLQHMWHVQSIVGMWQKQKHNEGKLVMMEMADFELMEEEENNVFENKPV